RGATPRVPRAPPRERRRSGDGPRPSGPRAVARSRRTPRRGARSWTRPAPPTRSARPRARPVPYEQVRAEGDATRRRTNWRTFVRLLAFLRPYRASLIVSSILAIGSQGAAILVPVLTGAVINELTGSQDTRVLVIEIALIIGLGLVRGALMLGRRFISGKQALAVEYDLRDSLYAHLL